MYTLAHAHFAEFNDIPAVDKLKVKPIGAFILVIQAVRFQPSFLIQTLIKCFVG